MKPLNSEHPNREVTNSILPSSAKTSGGAETLLLVDNERWVRELEAEILCQEGYSVLQAENAAEALRLAGEAPTIHLMITDFSMPEVDGLELTRRFRAVRPTTPVLMVSRSLPLLRDGGQDVEGLEILPKPFRLSELLHKVRTLLDAAPLVRMRTPWCHD